MKKCTEAKETFEKYCTENVVCAILTAHEAYMYTTFHPFISSDGDACTVSAIARALSTPFFSAGIIGGVVYQVTLASGTNSAVHPLPGQYSEQNATGKRCQGSCT